MKILSVRFKIPLAVLLKIQVIWGVTLCRWMSSAWPTTHFHIPENLCLQVWKCLLFWNCSVRSIRVDSLKHWSMLYMVDCFQDSALRVKECSDFSVMWYIRRSAWFALRLPVVKFEQTKEQAYEVYQNYQMAIHGDPPDKCTSQHYTRFLVNSPLQVKLTLQPARWIHHA